MEDKRRRKMQRRDIGRPGWALLLYYIFLNYVVMAAMMIQILQAGFASVIQMDNFFAFEEGIEQALYGLTDNGWGYLAACVAVVAAIPMWKGKQFFRDMFESKQVMTGNDFICIACIFFGGQLLFQIVAVIEELILNLFGLSVVQSMESASSGADSFSMFLYMGLGAPVVEEIIFRGVLMRSFQPQGKRFAIVGSAILFGLFHGNLVQSPYAFAVGLVLGYVTMEYSIGWAMVLHMLNNLVLGDSFLRLTSSLPEDAALTILWQVYFVSAFAAIVILIRKREQIRGWLLANPKTKGAMRAFFTAPSNLIMILLMGANAIMMLFL